MADSAGIILGIIEAKSIEHRTVCEHFSFKKASLCLYSNLPMLLVTVKKPLKQRVGHRILGRLSSRKCACVVLTLYLIGTTFCMVQKSHQGLIDPRSGERACNSAYACRDGKMLVVTKNRTKRMGGWQRQLCSLR